jgi:hypothetical protein
MKRQDPTITKERAKEMVDAYWASVPKFAEWAYSMKSVARKQLVCFTPDGRKIVIEGSANLRSSGNIESITVEECPEWFDVNRELLTGILERYKTIRKPLSEAET